jgi:NAD(P)-dependent dehydrogenase (short-subunit alcohol dehydrogenase family)
MRILITGANRGLGLGLAERGLEKGYDVAAAIRSEATVSRQLQTLRGRFKERLKILEMDVKSEVSVANAARSLGSYWGGLDVIVNNAAVLLDRDKTIEDVETSQILESFEINTLGPIRVVKKFLPLLVSGENQAVINISSEGGSITNAFPTNYPYSLSKTALNMFSERLRAHFKDRGIRVYAIHPGWIKTDMGGPMAPGDPGTTVTGIFDIIEQKTIVHSKIAFIDFTGRPMPL